MEQLVNPELRSTLFAMPEVNLDDIKTLRKELMEKNQVAPHPNVITSEKFIPGPVGAPEVRVRIYEPKLRGKELLPGLLYLHGGGYVLGTPEIEDPICNRIVSETECVIVSVDYRLAPEHPFPAGPEDCYAALVWFAENALDLGVDVSRLGVAGESAGGGLTAAVSLMARDRKGPKLCFQMPLYPMIDHRNVTPSSYRITDKRVWCREFNLKAWDLYLSAAKGEAVSPYAAPVHANDLTGLPPTYTFIGTLDPFLDETLAYVSRLSEAEVPVEFHLYPGCFHGFENENPEAEISRRAISGYIRALKDFWSR